MAVTGDRTPAPSAVPFLPALPDPGTDAVLDSGLLPELSHAFGGPFHFLLPDRFDANVAAFRTALAETGVDGRIHYAKKANKAAVWIERCAATGTGVDVASLGELREALGNGVRGERVVVTGPAKSDQLLRVAVLQACLIAVDSLDELDRLLHHAPPGAPRAPRILLRLLPPQQPGSRFGMTGAELDTALARCVAAGDAVRMEGFSFHLSGYAIPPRVELAAALLDRCLAARTMGLQADRISIGGGFAVDYCAPADWYAFLTAQRPGHYHADRTFDPADFYPYHSPVAGADALRAVLAGTTATGTDSGPRTLADRLRDTGTLLLLEPGRALLDGAGASVFRIQGVKDRAGYAIVTVDGTSLSLSEQWFNSEFLPQPVLVGADGRASGDAAHPACVGGVSCLESDLLTWRKVPFPRRPQPGDLLVYPNTAGYQMDSNESPFHELPLPPKVVLDRTDGRPRWRLDRRPAP
ncbi:Y4yA family PLP-dependent enzyme [Streptomyces sp. A1-5]|uniref:Y4yA family PLP-dependent enzyme n=1 Tax=Streptomyces sp. A1-5 TaxID=2738410 RepID=UPI001F2D295B|nr:Y4yA family PLP-dependent enzyme [Streptomyces sp. A1-5]UJB45248.1 Y4yA family PLP-dependent enzyme [Streptomyces sp. A1-5]